MQAVLTVKFKCSCEDYHSPGCAARRSWAANFQELRIRVGHLLSLWHPNVVALHGTAVDASPAPIGVQITAAESTIDRLAEALSHFGLAISKQILYEDPYEREAQRKLYVERGGPPVSQPFDGRIRPSDDLGKPSVGRPTRA